MNVFGTVIRLTPEQFAERVHQLTQNLETTLIQKNKDYGNASLENGGIIGNAVRLSDKFSRLKNMVDQMVGNPEYVPNFESLRDTILDIQGYATLGLIIYDEMVPRSEEDKSLSWKPTKKGKA